MEIQTSIGRWLIVCAEVSASQKGNKFQIVEDTQLAKAKVIAGGVVSGISVEPDMDILFVRKNGISLGHGMPANVMAITGDDVVCVIKSE